MTSTDPAPQAPPPSAAHVFGPHFAAACRYADLLCTQGVLRGLIGPREPARIWTRHLLNSAALAPLVPVGSTVVDLGSGAGLPGIPIVLVRPDVRMTLLEPLARRVSFLEEVRALLGLDVTVVRSRAEQAQLEPVDVVVARAVAPLDRLIELSAPLLRLGGLLLAQKGLNAEQEVAEAAGTCARLGIAGVSVQALEQDEQTGSGVPEGGTFVVRVVTGRQPIPLAPTARRRRGVR